MFQCWKQLICLIFCREHDIYFDNSLVSRNFIVTAFIKNTNLCNIINVLLSESTILFISKNKTRTDPNDLTVVYLQINNVT